MDAAELIALHARGAGESLAAAIERGEGPKVEPLPDVIVEAELEKSRAEQVGELVRGFKELKHRRKKGWLRR
jgi:hypothetical protein